MNSVIYARSEPVVLRIACPHCRMVSRYDVDFISDAIKDNKAILCVVCEERFYVITQKQDQKQDLAVLREHTCEEDFQYFLSYSGERASPKELIEKMRIAYFAAWGGMQ